ncbi:putative proteinDP-SPECIFIC GLUTAMATE DEHYDROGENASE [Salix koriyanagi]|uniref:Transmembrane protein n=1 Tax=Salix koriyanagi TaxID=2511006 RepID=A0A9Q0SZJ1_9ROSI|nr:putative proteinDP-SPECIFIC GLUTAMATE DEHYDROGENASE [Salix koriyanagi]
MGYNNQEPEKITYRLNLFTSCSLVLDPITNRYPSHSLLFISLVVMSLSLMGPSFDRRLKRTWVFIGLSKWVKRRERERLCCSGQENGFESMKGFGLRLYLREERVLEGIFRRDADLERWKLECYGGTGGDDVRVLAVRVAVEGQVAFVETVVTRKRKSKRGCDRLEVIPEGREVVEDESDGKCDCDGRGLYGGDLEEGCGPDCAEVEMELEGIRWAIDVGVWVMCLGVGYMVSRASVKSLRRLRFL